jgi:trans-L-3-hydroxyproline dehydratase
MKDEDLKLIRDLQRWTLPSHGLRIDAIDVHCGGEPLRLVIGGFPPLPGRTMAERCQSAREQLDHLRRALIHEPRGHPRQYGALLTPPERLDSHFGTLFFNGAGFRGISGHGIIAVATALVETGLVPMSGPETRLKLDTTVGLVRAFARVESDRVRGVFFENVPAFPLMTDRRTTVPGVGEIDYDIAFGGMAYAFVRAAQVGLACAPVDSARLRVAGRLIHAALLTEAAREPTDFAERFPLGGVVFIDEPPRRRGAAATAHTRHACVFAEGELNRSPGGAALSARAALEFAKGRLALGDALVVEGIAGAAFVAKAVAETQSGEYRALFTEVEGSAFITGCNSLFIDADDPFRDGFVLD